MSHSFKSGTWVHPACVCTCMCGRQGREGEVFVYLILHRSYTCRCPVLDGMYIVTMDNNYWLFVAWPEAFLVEVEIGFEWSETAILVSQFGVCNAHFGISGVTGVYDGLSSELAGQVHLTLRFLWCTAFQLDPFLLSVGVGLVVWRQWVCVCTELWQSHVSGHVLIKRFGRNCRKLQLLSTCPFPYYLYWCM